MDIGTLRAFFGWCTVLNGGLLLVVSLVVCTMAGDWTYRMTSRWFPISRETFNVTLYCFIGAMKLVVLMLNLVPYIALALIG